MHISRGSALGDELQKALDPFIPNNHLIIQESYHKDLFEVTLLHAHHHPKTQNETDRTP